MQPDGQSSDPPPQPANEAALLAERQLFWARFCRAAAWAILTIAAILVLLDWSLV